MYRVLRDDMQTADGKFVVVKDGQRVGGDHQERPVAESEAKQHQKVLEGRGERVSEGSVAVKQNIFG
jgi:hypothetical protein